MGALITAWGQGAKQKPEILLASLRMLSSPLPPPPPPIGTPEQAAGRHSVNICGIEWK